MVTEGLAGLRDPSLSGRRGLLSIKASSKLMVSSTIRLAVKAGNEATASKSLIMTFREVMTMQNRKKIIMNINPLVTNRYYVVSCIFKIILRSKGSCLCTVKKSRRIGMNISFHNKKNEPFYHVYSPI
jgi:hypothetical protein